MKRTKIALIICSISLMIMFSFMTIGGTGDDNDEGDGNYSIPVDKNSEYTYNSTRDGNQSYTTFKFEVQVKDDTYKISRIDDAANPGTSLRVEQARVVGSTLVIKEEFVDTTRDNVAAPSVVSTSGYDESWQLDLDIDTVAVEHPYGENPYIKNLE